MLVPHRANRMANIGCGSSGGSNTDPELLLGLQQQLEQQLQQIQALQNALAEKIDKSSLVMVHSLEDEPLFMAIPLNIGEQNGGSEN